MPSTFTTSCRFELQETGENLNVWGIALNTRAIALIDQAMDGYQSIDLASGATFDLSSATYTKNGESDTSRRRVLRFTNSNAAGTAITIPSVTKNYWIINAGSYPITFAPSGGATASVPAGTSAFIWTDGTDCFAFRARLNELAAPNGSVAMGSQKITGLADGTLDTDAVNKLQVTTLTAASVQLANDWAQKISDFVTGSDNSAKSWAIGGTGNGDPTAGSAKEWATSTSIVDSGLKGARGYANDASASATSASGFSTAASGYATTALGHSNTASGFATAASGSATSAANTLLDFQNKYVNNAGVGTFPVAGNFSGRVAWSGSAFGVYNGSGWDALTSTPAASETVQGIIEIATQAETNTGTDDNRAVTPLKLASYSKYRPGNVVKADLTSVFSTASTSYTDLTGLSVSITPSSASSRILIVATINGSTSLTSNKMFFKILRGSTDVLLGDAASARTRAHASYTGQSPLGTALMAVDSPATTSSTTYKIQCAVSAGTGYVNQGNTDTDAAANGRFASSIVVMEII